MLGCTTYYYTLLFCLSGMDIFLFLSGRENGHYGIKLLVTQKAEWGDLWIAKGMDSFLFIANCRVPAALCSLPNWCKDFHQNGNRAFIMLSIKCFFKNCSSISSLSALLHDYMYFDISKGKMPLVNTSYFFLCHSTHSTEKGNESWVKGRWTVWVPLWFCLKNCMCMFILLATLRSIIPYLQWQNPQCPGKWSYGSLPVKSVLNTWM